MTTSPGARWPRRTGRAGCADRHRRAPVQRSAITAGTTDPSRSPSPDRTSNRTKVGRLRISLNSFTHDSAFVNSIPSVTVVISAANRPSTADTRPCLDPKYRATMAWVNPAACARSRNGTPSGPCVA